MRKLLWFWLTGLGSDGHAFVSINKEVHIIEPWYVHMRKAWHILRAGK